MPGIVLDPSFVISSRGRQWVQRFTSPIPIVASAQLCDAMVCFDREVLASFQTPYLFYRSVAGGPIPATIRRSHDAIGLPSRIGMTSTTLAIISQTLAPLRAGCVMIGRRLEFVQLSARLGVPVLLRGEELHQQLLAEISVELTQLEGESLGRRARYLSRWRYLGPDLGEGLEVADVGVGLTR